MSLDAENVGEDLSLARKQAGRFGALPAPIFSATRFLLQDAARGASAPSSNTNAQLLRILRVPSLAVQVYFAAALFKKESLDSSDKLSYLELGHLFPADELAALIGVIYYTRKARTICAPDEWKYLIELIQRHANIGALVGINLSNIGFSSGLLVGALPFIGLAPISLADKKGFQEYRRYLKSRNLGLDPAFELDRWGCSGVQIGALLAQTLGFGIGVAEALLNVASEAPSHLIPSSDARKRLRAAFGWIQNLGSDNEQGDEELSTLGGPPALDSLLSSCDQAKTGGSLYEWLSRTKADLTAASAPQLCSKPVSTAAQGTGNTQAQRRYLYTDLPEPVREVLSEEDFAAMGDDEVEQLLASFSGQ